ncbi:MAG: hypothetical protein AMXMBFR7_26330 [Planctomycetota bacterium]
MHPAQPASVKCFAHDAYLFAASGFSRCTMAKRTSQVVSMESDACSEECLKRLAKRPGIVFLAHVGPDLGAGILSVGLFGDYASVECDKYGVPVVSFNMNTGLPFDAGLRELFTYRELAAHAQIVLSERRKVKPAVRLKRRVISEKVLMVEGVVRGVLRLRKLRTA